MPSRPQVVTAALGHALGARGGAPFGTNEHVPGAAAVLHDLHVSLHAVLQQTPSAQNPLEQSPPHPHPCPLAFFIAPVPLHATAPIASMPPSSAGALFPHAPTAVTATTSPTSHICAARSDDPDMALPWNDRGGRYPCTPSRSRPLRRTPRQSGRSLSDT